MASQSLKSVSFSIHFWLEERKFSWWASPIFVMIPIVGAIMGCRRSISSGCEIPASKMPSVFSRSSAIPREEPPTGSCSSEANVRCWTRYAAVDRGIPLRSSFRCYRWCRSRGYWIASCGGWPAFVKPVTYLLRSGSSRPSCSRTPVAYRLPRSCEHEVYRVPVYIYVRRSSCFQGEEEAFSGKERRRLSVNSKLTVSSSNWFVLAPITLAISLIAYSILLF